MKKYVQENSKKFIFFYINCKWKLNFSSYHTGFIYANTEYKHFFLLGSEPCDMLETYLFTQIEYLYSKEALDTYHIGEMKITFISEVRFMTYHHYLDMPKQMVELNLIRKVHENPKLIRSLQKLSEPTLIEYDCYLYSDSEDEDADYI